MISDDETFETCDLSSLSDTSIDSYIPKHTYIKLNQNDLSELIDTINTLIEEYITLEFISYSKPDFLEIMSRDITDVIIHDFYVIYNNVTDELYDDLLNFIQIYIKDYCIVFNIHKRSESNDIINNKDYDSIQKLNSKINALQNIVLPEQKSREWYEFRYELITASNIWKVFGSESQQNSLIFEKCKPLDVDSYMRNSTMGSLHWGVKYEPITIMIYENMNNTKIGEFGCIPHPKYSFIGASPDGINIEPYNNDKYGRMIEIKNIVNREITGIPKEEYWIQTQVQMETCDLDECDFIETRIKEYNNEEQFLEDNTHNYKGIVLHFIEKPPTEMNENTTLSSTPIYKYMPLNIPINNTNIQNWINYEKEDMKQKNLVLFEVNYWYLDEYSCVLIQRNRLWFSYAINKIEKLWNTIIHERIKGYAHRATKKRKRTLSLASDDATVSCSPPRIIGCLINIDDDGNVINN